MANFQGKEKAVMKVGLVTSPVLPDVLALSFPTYYVTPTFLLLAAPVASRPHLRYSNPL